MGTVSEWWVVVVIQDLGSTVSLEHLLLDQRQVCFWTLGFGGFPLLVGLRVALSLQLGMGGETLAVDVSSRMRT